MQLAYVQVSQTEWIGFEEQIGIVKKREKEKSVTTMILYVFILKIILLLYQVECCLIYVNAYNQDDELAFCFLYCDEV